MTDKEKLLQLIQTGEQENIDLGVYLWLAHGFSKTELSRRVSAKLFQSNEMFDSFEFKISTFSLVYSYDDSCWQNRWTLRLINKNGIQIYSSSPVSPYAFSADLWVITKMMILKVNKELAVPE